LTQFPVLDELSLFANKITNLNGLHLPQKLKLVNFAFNDLRDCEPAETFATYTLDLSSNFLTAVPLRMLTDASLRSITLSRAEISGALDFELPVNVISIDVSYNRITRISERFVASTAKVQTFRIGSNQIQELPDCFPENLALNKFVADENLLEVLPASLLRGRHLETVSCASCLLRTLPEFNLPQLETLTLQFNQIGSLPDSFESAPLLNVLNISFNQLSSLPRSLATCRNVTAFYAASNWFLKFPRALLSFSKLKTLVLSGNKLTSIPTDLASFFYLNTVDFSNNHLQSYPVQLNCLRALKILSLSHNAISSIAAQMFPPNLVIADFSFNLLEEIPPGLQQTACVCLDFNPITKLDPSAFKGLHFLSTNGCRIQGRLIDQLPSFIHESEVRFIEAIGNEDAPVEIPPLRLHILDSSSCSFPLRFGVGYSATLGRRASMEDCVALKNFDDHNFLCAVFDGHGGSFAAATAAHCIQEEVRIRLIEAASDGLGIEKALVGCLNAVNQQLRIVDAQDGCTGAVAFIHGDRVYAASVGDSRIVRVGSSTCERLTVDAKPTIRSEYVRLRQAGLVITTEGRVRGKFSVARAFGDFACGDGLYVEPDVSSFVIGEDDDALIVACDGLWDMLSDEVCASIVRRAATAVDAAVTLKNYAFALGSIDNISVIVVKFHPEEENRGFCPRNTVELLPIVESEPGDDEYPAMPLQGQRRSRR
jgi:adenylate cyclase